MTATLTTVNGMLKEVYEPGGVRDQLQNDLVLLKRITRSSEQIFETPGGKYVVFPLHTGRNHGISYRAEGAALAAAGRQKYAQAQETLRYGYGRIQVTGQTMKLAKTNAQAFMNAVDGEMDGMKTDITKDQNRISWGHSQSWVASSGTGGLTTVTTGATSATQTVASTASLMIGEIVDVVDNTGVPVAGGTGILVNSITSATVVVLSASVTTVTNASHIVRTGNWNQEPYGLAQLIDDTGTLHNINSATAGNEYWRSQDDGAVTVLTEAAVIKMADDIKTQSGKIITAIFSSLGVRRTYFNLLTTLRRYNEPKTWAGGLVGLSFMYENDLPWVAAIDAPSKSAHLVNEGELTVYRDEDWYWEDTDGGILKYVHGFDMFEGLMKSYWQFVNHQRNGHGRFTNLTEA